MKCQCNHSIPAPRPPAVSNPPGRAFTLIELLVVVAVMALLFSILLPSLGRAREDARRTVCLSNLKHIGAALFTYASVNRENGPQVVPVRPTGSAVGYQAKTAPRNLLSVPGQMVNVGLLWPRMIGDAKEFNCPSQSHFVYESDPREFQQDEVVGSYAYAIHIPSAQSPRLSAIRHLAMASDDFTAGSDRKGVGQYSHRVGYNVLYTDGSVSWYPDVDGSIWKRTVYWDDETDGVTYATYYANASPTTPGAYAVPSTYDKYDIFRVWRSFCYHRPDPF